MNDTQCFRMGETSSGLNKKSAVGWDGWILYASSEVDCPPIQFQCSPTSTFPTSFFVFLISNHYTYRITIKHSTLHSCSMQYTSFVPVPAPPLQSTITCSTFNFHILLYYTTIPLSIGRMKGKENPLIQFYLTISTPPQNPLTQF